MARYKLILAYDGTAFHGYQRQARERTVQQEFEKVLAGIGWPGETILAAGRTDAGVHASGQVVSFVFDWDHEKNDLLNAINAGLSKDVAAKNIVAVADDFHPRYDARSRRYRYQVICEKQPDPLRERYFWRIWPQPDFGVLQEAAKHFIGEHDFTAFGSPPKQNGNTVREVFSSQWIQVDDQMIYEISATAFLYHMVRHIVGLQIQIGQGKHVPAVVLNYLNPQEQIHVQELAPPQGLFLAEVRYE